MKIRDIHPLTAMVWTLLIIIALVLAHRNGGLYANNQWKKHRWTSDVCKANGMEPTLCTQKWNMQMVGSSETAYMDMCLEHGEYRRIK